MDGDGRDAASPWHFTGATWWQVLKRTMTEQGNDNVSLIAAGVAFYGFLALVPLLGAIVLSYGLIADQHTVLAQMQQLTTVMPKQAAQVIGDQLLNIVNTSGGKKGLGLLLALVLALFGARNGATAIITALNVAYEEKEQRSFVKLTLLALVITLGAVLVAILAFFAIAALALLDDLLKDTPAFVVGAGKLFSYVVLLLAGAGGAATLYRYGPCRPASHWVWLTPGSLLASLLWLALTFAFGIYVANFGNYNATYGSLGAVVVLLTWLYLSSYVLLLGAEFNSACERQTRPEPAKPAEAVGKVAGEEKPNAVARARAMPPKPSAARTAPSPIAAFATARLAAHIRRRAVPRVGTLTPALASFGLAQVRKRGGIRAGLAMLGAATLLAWLGREPSNRA